jgi:hypothetical protein
LLISSIHFLGQNEFIFKYFSLFLQLKFICFIYERGRRLNVFKIEFQVVGQITSKRMRFRIGEALQLFSGKHSVFTILEELKIDHLNNLIANTC